MNERMNIMQDEMLRIVENTTTLILVGEMLMNVSDIKKIKQAARIEIKNDRSSVDRGLNSRLDIESAIRAQF